LSELPYDLRSESESKSSEIKREPKISQNLGSLFISDLSDSDYELESDTRSDHLRPKSESDLGPGLTDKLQSSPIPPVLTEIRGLKT
jgi:hypothetical protein